ncbi:hypothetical protein PIROE2DRAFT_7138 [Piromyces sp. E2]|nr:hypothetical protein PIROE2DRAFT_7138 [Piromyces sp. E2]|eukprot:OUM65809.1 hypothetical protein PIROE2DRAFT_7138 [Piromyces sp. E2]
MLDGIYYQFKDTFFFSYIIQFILVTLLYFSVGSGLLSALFENMTVAYICQKSQINNTGKVYTFFLAEIFWVLTEYSIPYLNLIKMKALSKDKKAKYIKYCIYALFVPFAIMRFLIGYTRMQRGYLNDKRIELLHGFAFGVMAISDIICTTFILYFIHQYNRRVTINPSFFIHYIQHSSYTILITVDVCSILLSLLYIIVNIVIEDGTILTGNCVLPFHSFKSVFLLILAVDACIFKYGANVTALSTHGTTDYGSTRGTGTGTGTGTAISDNKLYKPSVEHIITGTSSLGNFNNYSNSELPQSPKSGQYEFSSFTRLC